MKPFLLSLVLFFLIMLFLGSALFGGEAAGGVLVAVVTSGVLVGIQYSKYLRMQDGTVLRFSEHGVELTDMRGWRVSLGWRDITHVGPVVTQMANPKPVGPDAVKVSIGPMRSLGISGWGERVIPPSTPRWQREQLAAQPHNPTDGRPMVAIPLGGSDPNWTNGAMGQWVRRYRPDLLG